MDALHLHGLYAVTPDTLDDAWLAERVEQALRGGARAVQYRGKHADAQVRRRQAQRLLHACRAHGALFVVNDDVDLALQLGADGVHLGRDDVAVAVARARVGRGALIGASCYDDLAHAERAVQAGADYLAFGSFFPSTVKPDAVRPSLELLRQARRRWRLPLVAIGGIDRDNAARVIEAGADAVAVITALFSVPDTFAAACAFSRLFQQPTMPAL
ncbi:MAG TPA: thiamine phosphate synthase [Burkholderiales bacterium]|jgi:thiamine-phosphate pyrophosphorylase